MTSSVRFAPPADSSNIKEALGISDNVLEPWASAAARKGMKHSVLLRMHGDDFLRSSSIPAGALQLEHGAACDCDGTEGEKAGWRHRSSCCPGELQKAGTLHFCWFSGPHPQSYELAISHFKVTHCWDIQRPCSCHSCSWGQELGNEFQQDNQILPASCCNLLVLQCHLCTDGTHTRTVWFSKSHGGPSLRRAGHHPAQRQEISPRLNPRIRNTLGYAYFLASVT